MKTNPNLDEGCGIYILTRIDEEEFKFAYVGQAKHILTRLAQHLAGYQHIDLSLKKHGLFDINANPCGWKADFILCREDELDEKEKEYIKLYAGLGYQLRNVTSGSQGDGKRDIGERKPARGYLDGIERGKSLRSAEIGKLFKTKLKAEINGKETPTKVEALRKFKELIGEEE